MILTPVWQRWFFYYPFVKPLGQNANKSSGFLYHLEIRWPGCLRMFTRRNNECILSTAWLYLESSTYCVWQNASSRKRALKKRSAVNHQSGTKGSGSWAGKAMSFKRNIAQNGAYSRFNTVHLWWGNDQKADNEPMFIRMNWHWMWLMTMSCLRIQVRVFLTSWTVTVRSGYKRKLFWY